MAKMPPNANLAEKRLFRPITLIDLLNLSKIKTKYEVTGVPLGIKS